MKNPTLPTNNPEWGLWGTSISNGYDAALVWDATSRFLTKAFALTPEETSTMLPARCGRPHPEEVRVSTGGPVPAGASPPHLSRRA
ncbi:MAG: hypothetical protein ACK5R4_08825, partial [Alphaproteobacteria bacterium]